MLVSYKYEGFKQFILNLSIYVPFDSVEHILTLIPSFQSGPLNPPRNTNKSRAKIKQNKTP